MKDGALTAEAPIDYINYSMDSILQLVLRKNDDENAMCLYGKWGVSRVLFSLQKTGLQHLIVELVLINF